MEIRINSKIAAGKYTEVKEILNDLSQKNKSVMKIDFDS